MSTGTLNFDNKLLREVPDFCAAHLLHLSFQTKLYRQNVGIPMGINCAPLVAVLFLFCYERDFMKDLSSDNQADVIKTFN